MFKKLASAVSERHSKRAAPAHEFCASPGAWKRWRKISKGGSTKSAMKKKAPMSSSVTGIVYGEKSWVLTSAVAMAIATHKMTSSIVATAIIILAKRVCEMCKSRNILEITGMDVTATAHPIMILKA